MNLPLFLTALSQGPSPEYGVDQVRVDKAIVRGTQYLVSQKDVAALHEVGNRHQGRAMQSVLELVVLTLIHAGLSEDDPQVRALLDQMLKKELNTTYTVSVQAMALQKISPRKYQGRIAQCAQFLADNQAANGQWDYGAPTDVGSFQPKPVIKTQGGPGAARKESAADLPRIEVKKKKQGPPSGDNSNSQYAALGVRACLESGIVIDRDVLLKARKWWVESQCHDGGWNYNDKGWREDRDTKVLEGRPKASAGGGGTGQGAMTAGAIGAVCIYSHFLHMLYRDNASVTHGLKWMADHYDVKSNPGRGADWQFYYLYGLERAGVLYGTDKFGGHPWYADGANRLLEIQKEDGGWHDDTWEWGKRDVSSTCFAILFLKRATAPLIYSKAARE